VEDERRKVEEFSIPVKRPAMHGRTMTSVTTRRLRAAAILLAEWFNLNGTQDDDDEAPPETVADSPTDPAATSVNWNSFNFSTPATPRPSSAS